MSVMLQMGEGGTREVVVDIQTHQTQVNAGHVARLALARHAALGERHIAAYRQASVAARRVVQLHVHLVYRPGIS